MAKRSYCEYNLYPLYSSFDHPQCSEWYPLCSENYNKAPPRCGSSDVPHSPRVKVTEDQLYAAAAACGIARASIAQTDPLPGEVDANFRLTLTGGKSYVLKIGPAGAFDQSPILAHLHQKELPFATPVVAAAGTFTIGEETLAARLHTWIPGRVLDSLHPRTPQLISDWGTALARLHVALGDLAYPATHRSYKWDTASVLQQRKYAATLDENRKFLAEYFFARLARLDFSALPLAVCYNDAHEHNLLVDAAGNISGIVDFGDTVFTVAASEVAVACAYAAMGQQDPLHTVRTLVQAYHRVQPLTEQEVNQLYDLIAARLLLTVTIAARNESLFTENPYLSVSATPAWELLSAWRNLPPGLVTAACRLACGYPAHPQGPAFDRWAATARFVPVLRDFTRPIPLDLSVGSTQLGATDNFADRARFVVHLRRILEDAEAELAVGGYGEVRPVYTTDDFEGRGNFGPRWRSVHLGLDYWTRSAGPPVFCPLDGSVACHGIDPTAGGYGGTLILRHEPEPGLRFYTLYGHLDYASVRHLGAGAQVNAGQAIGRLGTPEQNGGWPPHLHFQVMLDLLDLGVDYPGVAYPEDRDIWLGLCPDPRLVQPPGLPQECAPQHSVGTLMEARKERLGYSLSVSYASPLQILRGYRQYLYDHTGRRYLDTVNNVAHVGHEHPYVVAAAQRQMAVLNTNTRYLHPALPEFAAALTATLPPELSVVYVVNSGSEANELALRMAEAVTGNRQIAAMEMGYHGNTARTIDVSSYKFDRAGGAGQPPETFLYALPGAADRHPPTLPPGTWSFIGESVLSCAGQVPLPPAFVRKVYAQIRAVGGVCIADEVQTGVGRLGSHWWAFESLGVVPDIVTVGKPIGNGHPLGAVVCTPEVAQSFANGMEYFNTFGGNPVSATVGTAVLKTVMGEGLRENACATGGYLKARLRELSHRHPLIADVRGEGFFLGVELRDSRGRPATDKSAYLKNRMRELGFLLSTDGPHENVIKLKPPMCFTVRNADQLCQYLDKVLRENAMQREAD